MEALAACLAANGMIVTAAISATVFLVVIDHPSLFWPFFGEIRYRRELRNANKREYRSTTRYSRFFVVCYDSVCSFAGPFHQFDGGDLFY
jgi:hypothetical protein